MNAATYVADAFAASEQFGSLQDRWIMPSPWNALAAIVLLVVLGPLMLIVAFLIWRFDGRPVLFAHYRVGYEGKLFRCLKFRTMVPEAEQVLADLLRTDPQARMEWVQHQKLADDPRVTRPWIADCIGSTPTPARSFTWSAV